MGRIRKHSVCRVCETLYELGFFGTGTVYCSRRCAGIGHNENAKMRYKEKQRKMSMGRECILCHRNILAVGKRRIVSKFCSKKCMFTHSRMKLRKDKFIMIKVPVQEFLDGNIKVNLNGKVNIGGKLIGVYDGKQE